MRSAAATLIMRSWERAQSAPTASATKRTDICRRSNVESNCHVLRSSWTEESASHTSFETETRTVNATASGRMDLAPEAAPGRISATEEPRSTEVAMNSRMVKGE